LAEQNQAASVDRVISKFLGCADERWARL